MVRILAIVGPTGTGKTAAAIHVARRLDGEIVGCDALQVYRGLNSATAKPTPEERRQVPHHLIDAADPGQDFNLADYVRAAGRSIADIAGRGRVPLVVGGTGLYLRGLLRGIVEVPPRDPALRDRLRSMAARFGTPRLHRWLRRLDPESAVRLPAGDAQRVVRALEIAIGGQATWSERLARHGTWSRGVERYPSLKVGLDMDRELLSRRLRERVDGFFDAGLVGEVRSLLAAGLPPSSNVLKAIGYREVLAALEAGRNPDDERDAVFRSTRRYTRRQRTWFRKEPDIVWMDADDTPEEIATRIVERWHGEAGS